MTESPSNPTLSIAPLEASQIPDLAELAQQTWLATFTAGLSESDINDALKQRDLRDFKTAFGTHLIWVAVVAKEIVGFIECASRDEDVLVDKLYIAVQFQGQGIGRALLAHALNSSALLNRPVELDVWIENPRAIALYRSFDFKVIGERPFSSSSGEVLSPDLIMRRDPV